MIVSGKDRLILAKGVDAVHKTIKEGGDVKGSSSSRVNGKDSSSSRVDVKGSSSSRVSKSRSPVRSPVGDRTRRFDTERSSRGPPNGSHFQQRFNKPEKVVEDRIREDLQRVSKASPPQGRGSLGNKYGIDREMVLVVQCT